MKKALVTILILCLVSTICFVSNAQAASAIAGAAVSQNTVNGKLAAAIRSNNMFKACLSELKVEGVTLTDPVVSEIQGEILVNYFPVAPSEINTVVVRLDTSYNVLDVLIVRQSSDESYSVHSYATGITHLT
ncbi:MAG: hypothetical protein Q8S19_06460, partial [Bacillota bacterium]|nr:hypothetical protein [Bacillota bacterium]